MEITFTVKVLDGEVYINNEFVAQLCWDPDSIGSAIAVWAVVSCVVRLQETGTVTWRFLSSVTAKVEEERRMMERVVRINKPALETLMTFLICSIENNTAPFYMSLL